MEEMKSTLVKTEIISILLSSPFSFLENIARQKFEKIEETISRRDRKIRRTEYSVE